jgi:hypothetical protein
MENILKFWLFIKEKMKFGVEGSRIYYALASDACSRPPITIRFHDLHVGNIRKAMGEIASYHERD